MSKKVKEGLSIEVQHGMISTDFLDVTLNLEKNEYRPYRKPNDFPLYIDIRYPKQPSSYDNKANTGYDYQENFKSLIEPTGIQ